ncbi:hypothetical protein FOXG_14231 [Fusarium oxysporum f. sp. lycopersici 4287]|uniref:Uncharacterized protein n=1 Tax=Fusarium oxysporum f. sp. lycopersici (strain 4287 / CBS 123668 / FGSC 9935 / NRRL 34936) TaxID=426428 RepID=A0A0J9VYN7_FUSO4|nr:hypothetical protein FOXG_14231 [Fusarium oxysporum f. sp. lycopersici 4287]EWZ78293.1 hypothetical protein FOWG_17413 [Fusarium oxysporum f. sp. lycopersici MN25]KNB15896.1 hypothetical protein FOXG_14231 [Fusarium oxysporum f. sp. lycopersici 4287]
MEANASVGTSAVLLLWQTCLNSPLTSYTMATISSYFGAAGGRRPDSDRVILAPTHISPRPNDPDEFKLNGKQYVRYSVMAKSQKHTKKRTPVVWQYGEDIQLKQDPTKRFWYCYLCEQQQRQQGLPISGKVSQRKTRPDPCRSRGDTLSQNFRRSDRGPLERSSLSYVLSIEPDLPAVPTRSNRFCSA